jgi:hypothetical protein
MMEYGWSGNTAGEQGAYLRTLLYQKDHGEKGYRPGTYRGLERHPGQKALVVSGFSESRDVKMAMELGVGGFVKKPCSMAQIATAVKMELEREASVSGG